MGNAVLSRKQGKRCEWEQKGAAPGTLGRPEGESFSIKILITKFLIKFLIYTTVLQGYVLALLTFCKAPSQTQNTVTTRRSNKVSGRTSLRSLICLVWDNFWDCQHLLYSRYHPSDPIEACICLVGVFWASFKLCWQNQKHCKTIKYNYENKVIV